VGVWSENVGAQRLYARYGFEKIGEYDFPVGAQLDREFILKQVR
jgi:RimJ/RimL family protein N-acetyltransferase